MSAAERPVAPGFVAGRREGARLQFAAAQFDRQFRDAAELQIELEYRPNSLGFVVLDDERAFVGAVSERHEAAHPHTFLLRGSNLVPDALARDLSLELRKRQEDVEG